MRHAEGNDTDAPTRMLQLWFPPTSTGGPAAYFYRQLPKESGQHLVAGDAAMPLRCDVRVWWLDVNGSRSVELAAGRQGYVLALHGPLTSGKTTLETGDGAVMSAGALALEGTGAALLIELPAER